MFTIWNSVRQNNRIARRRQERRGRPRLELLEGRTLLTAYSVNSNGDSATGTGTSGTMRYVLTQLDQNGGTSNSISFNLPSNELTITPGSALPSITAPVVIDGSTQPNGGSATPVELDGKNAGSSTSGLTIAASNCTIKGLAIVNFSDQGIDINSGSGILITGNSIGLKASGSLGANADSGVLVESSATAVTIGGTTAAAANVFAGNGERGIHIDGSSDDLIEGNYVGTNSQGATTLGNGDSGILIDTGSGVTIGGSVAGAGNTIADSGGDGIHVTNTSTGTVIEGNFVGTNSANATNLGNAEDGVLIDESSTGTTVGGTTTNAVNTISGNLYNGVDVDGVSGNLVAGNSIGTNVGATGTLGNVQSGVYIQDGSTSNTIGGSTAAAANVLLGNTLQGVYITGGSSDNLVEGNFIGTNSKGAGSLGNADDGILIDSTSNGNTIGGTAAAEGNTIAGNAVNGIHITGGTSDTLVLGNFIGTNSASASGLGNGQNGVLIDGGSNANTIGATSGAVNVISGNSLRGVHINGSSGNLVEGNDIGTNAADTATLGNTDSGVLIDGSSTNNTIGGKTVGAGNTIAGNQGDGVHISGSSSDNLVEGNFIGTNASSATHFGNGLDGVLIDGGSSHNTVGGAATGASNTISGNDQDGVMFNGATHNVVQGNIIGTNVGGTTDLGNGFSGILLENQANNNLIGGTTTAAANVLSGNAFRGLHITNDSSANLVEGNWIGTNSAGATGLGNGYSGVLIEESSHNNTIGGTAVGAGNTIAGNDGDGIHITTHASDNVVQGNWIGTDAAGSTKLGNADAGVVIDDGAAHNTIGGTATDAGNTISDNGLCGVSLSSAGPYNKIESDTIESNGYDSPANEGDGIAITNTAYTSVIDCVIDDNRDWGLFLKAAGGTVHTGDTYQGNGKGGVHGS
jgi:hypothetical protein